MVVGCVMKPREKKPETVFRIINAKTGIPEGSYSRACCDEFDFSCIEEARCSNFHGRFGNKVKYKIAKYRVTYELIDDDCDPANAEDVRLEKERRKKEAEIEDRIKRFGYTKYTN